MPLLRELGIGFVPYSPLGHGFLTGMIWCFTGENFQHNLRIADEVQAIAAEAGATPAQVELAWLLAKGDDIAPIPGTKRVSRVGENIAAESSRSTPRTSPRPATRPPSRCASSSSSSWPGRASKWT